MGDKKGVIGGFVSVNNSEGQINNCYCATRFSGAGFVAGGFVGKNDGRISTSYCEAMSRNTDGNFAADKNSGQTKCNFISDKTPKKKAWDDDCFFASSDVSQKSAMEKGFDTEKIWKVSNKLPHLSFIDENWIYDVNSKKKKLIRIKNADELFQFAKMINSGDRRANDVYARLENDIDLGGKEWTPIGYKRVYAFSGIFDGNGYTVKNFVISNEDIIQKGFFGFLKGEVYNLSVDCQIKGSGKIGTLVACNEGKIACCGATFYIKLKNRDSDIQVGGLVCINEGIIERSYAAGKYAFGGFWIFPAAITASAAVLAFSLWVVNPFSTRGQDALYSPIEEDPEQVETDITYESTESAEHTLSFQFSEHLNVDRVTGDCEINFVNPESDDYNIVVELQISDADAIKMMGGTGRPEELQTAFENADDYDPETGRVTIACSGAVKPGYALEKINLSNYSKINLDSGEIQGYIVLVPFDPVTNERGFVQTELPVTISLY